MTDILGESEYWGDLPRIRPQEIVGKEIVVHGFRKMTGRYGEFCVVKASLGNRTITFPCSWKVVVSKLERIPQFPIRATVVLRGNNRRFYDMA